MVEAVDNEFAAERFGSKATPVFKPVTYNLFEHLGDEWSAYAPIYDPVAAQSALRLDKFEQEVGWKPVHRSPGEVPNSFNRPANELKRFIDKRAEFARRQMDGKSRGMILKYPEKMW